MVLWQPKGGHELPEASSAGALGAETGWYFRDYEDGICHAETLTIATERTQIVETLRDVVACLGYASVDVCVDSAHQASIVLYQRERIDTEQLEGILLGFRSLLLDDRQMGITIIDPESDCVVVLPPRKVIEVVGALREDFLTVCRMHGIPPNPKLQLLDVGGLEGTGVGYQKRFDRFIKALAAKVVTVPQQEDEEEDHPYTPF